ncbi:4827_t:CDS:2 [Gigaspora rosea]|nr:4827_t:CDS:2 [Gigaspora rosea]
MGHNGTIWDLKRCYQENVEITKNQNKTLTHRQGIDQINKNNKLGRFYENEIGAKRINVIYIIKRNASVF